MIFNQVSVHHLLHEECGRGSEQILKVSWTTKVVRPRRTTETRLTFQPVVILSEVPLRQRLRGITRITANYPGAVLDSKECDPSLTKVSS